MNLNELLESVGCKPKCWHFQAQTVESIADYHFNQIPIQLTETGFKTVIFPQLVAGLTISDHVQSKGFINIVQGCYLELEYDMKANEINFTVSDHVFKSIDERVVNIATCASVTYTNNQGVEVTLRKDRTNSQVIFLGDSSKNEIAEKFDLNLSVEMVTDLFKEEVSTSNKKLLESCKEICAKHYFSKSA